MCAQLQLRIYCSKIINGFKIETLNHKFAASYILFKITLLLE